MWSKFVVLSRSGNSALPDGAEGGFKRTGTRTGACVVASGSRMAELAPAKDEIHIDVVGPDHRRDRITRLNGFRDDSPFLGDALQPSCGQATVVSIRYGLGGRDVLFSTWTR